MGDISAEPSMEDILSSIKRIIAEESDPGSGRGRRPARSVAATSEPRPFDREEILELSEPAPETGNAAEPRYAVTEPRYAVTEPAPAPVRSSVAVESLRAHPTLAATPAQDPPQVEVSAAAAPTPIDTRAPAEAILSQRATDASRGPLDALSRLVVKPEVAGTDTLEGMVREMLRPMLRDWLDAHLPTMVEEMVAREIKRITGR